MFLKTSFFDVFFQPIFKTILVTLIFSLRFSCYASDHAKVYSDEISKIQSAMFENLDNPSLLSLLSLSTSASKHGSKESQNVKNFSSGSANKIFYLAECVDLFFDLLPSAGQSADFTCAKLLALGYSRGEISHVTLRRILSSGHLRNCIRVDFLCAVEIFEGLQKKGRVAEAMQFAQSAKLQILQTTANVTEAIFTLFILENPYLKNDFSWVLGFEQFQKNRLEVNSFEFEVSDTLKGWVLALRARYYLQNVDLAGQVSSQNLIVDFLESWSQENENLAIELKQLQNILERKVTAFSLLSKELDIYLKLLNSKNAFLKDRTEDAKLFKLIHFIGQSSEKSGDYKNRVDHLIYISQSLRSIEAEIVGNTKFSGTRCVVDPFYFSMVKKRYVTRRKDVLTLLIANHGAQSRSLNESELELYTSASERILFELNEFPLRLEIHSAKRTMTDETLLHQFLDFDDPKFLDFESLSDLFWKKDSRLKSVLVDFSQLRSGLFELLKNEKTFVKNCKKMASVEENSLEAQKSALRLETVRQEQRWMLDKENVRLALLLRAKALKQKFENFEQILKDKNPVSLNSTTPLTLKDRKEVSK